MPHVVHVYKDYWPPVVGGIERCINWMANGVRAIDPSWEMTVLVNSRSGETRERQHGDVRVIEVGELGRAFSAPVAPAFPLWMKRLSADIWHFHVPNPTGDVAWLMARPPGKVAVTWHSDVVRQKWAMAAYGPLLRKFLTRADVIMPTSPRLIEHSDYLRPVREKCRPVPLGLPLGRFERTAEAARRARTVKAHFRGFPLVCFVGKLRYYKGLQFLISALRGLPNVHALLIGEGPEGENLLELAKELEVRDRVHFLGELSDDDVVAHLHASDVFVLPSHLPSEAFGLSQVEAMAAGLPVVCCDLPTGVPWVNVHGETGLVVPPGDDGALARAIAELLNDQSKRMHMAETATRRAQEEFTVERMSERVLEVYRDLLAGK